MKIYNVSFLRALILPIIKWTAFDFSMKHPWSNNGKVRLNSFLHKGYWYHRKNREKRSMLLFSSLIKEGDTVVEVGGHIGFISTYFASLVGKMALFLSLSQALIIFHI